MNADSPDSLIAVSPTSESLSPILARAFILKGKLPEELVRCLHRLRDDPTPPKADANVVASLPPLSCL